LIIILIASVPEEVKIISEGDTANSLAIFFRAFSMKAFVVLPKLCVEEGLPKYVKELYIFKYLKTIIDLFLEKNMEITKQVGNQGNISPVQKSKDNIKNIKNLRANELANLDKLSPKEKSRTQFLEKFEKIKSESVKEELEKIFDKISAQSDKIGEKVYLKDIIEYKKLVKEFLNVATSNSHQFSNENFLDRKRTQCINKYFTYCKDT